MGLLRVLLFLAFFATAATQVYASVDGISHLFGWSSFFSWIFALAFGWSPLLGTAIAIYGAHVAWHWSWLATLALFLWPVVLFIGISAFDKD